MNHWLTSLTQRLRNDSGPKGRVGPLLIGVFIVSIAIAAGIGFTQSEQAKADSRSRESIRVLVTQTETADKTQSFTRNRTYLGMVEPFQTSQVGFELSGGVQEVYVREGEQVTRGQVIAELDTLRLSAARREARAGLSEAEASLALAQTTLARTERARDLNAVSNQQMDEARRNLDMQRAMVSRVAAQLERIDVDLTKSTLRAPFDGIISRRFIDQGTVVNAGQPILEIMETGSTEIRLGIDRSLSDSLTPGTTFEAEFNGKSFPIQVKRVLPGRNNATRAVEVIAALTDDKGYLREGDLVTVRLDEQVVQEGFWLPVAALMENSRGLWSCYVAEPLKEAGEASGATHRLTRRDLELIAMEANRVYVTGGLHDGDQVVVEGLHRVVPDQRVRISRRDLGLTDSPTLVSMAN